MLNFDEERFLRIQNGAVALADDLDLCAADAVAAGVRSVWFVGSGGPGSS